MCVRVCLLLHVCVFVSREALRIVASRDVAELASCSNTQEAELEQNMTYIAISEGGRLAFRMNTQ